MINYMRHRVALSLHCTCVGQYEVHVDSKHAGLDVISRGRMEMAFPAYRREANSHMKATLQASKGIKQQKGGGGFSEIAPPPPPNAALVVDCSGVYSY